MPCAEHAAKRERARALRRAGWSRSEIANELGTRDNGTLAGWLRGIPRPDRTRKQRRYDSYKDRAIKMRASGYTYSQIMSAVPVSKSSLSLWLRDVAISAEHRQVLEERWEDAVFRRAATRKARRLATIERVKDESSAEVGTLSDRELLLLGVVAYWAEGSKSKPWSPYDERVSFINSDPTMIQIFLAWLRLLGVGKDDLILRISIHEKADIAAAQRFWSEVTDVPEDRFKEPALKRHNPSTIRHNKGRGYVGCLTITVRRGTNLYRRVVGWYEGIVRSLGPGVTAARRPLEPSGAGSNPAGPAPNHSTLFDPSPTYQCQRAS
jgi:hypothetical protein